MGNRFIELDALRGIAILMMIIFHFVFDLNFLGIYKVEPYEGFWLIFQRTTASFFILLVGVGLSLMRQKYGENYSIYFKRGLIILGLGLLVTLATYIYPGDGVIVFGILHFIGISILISPLFFRFGNLNLLLTVLIIFAGFNLWSVDTNLLIWLGFTPEDFYTLDYFPLLPWFGLVLIGFVLGNYFYADGRRIRFIEEHQLIRKMLDKSVGNSPWLEKPSTLTDLPIKLNLEGPIANGFSFLGRNSLLIYLIHQPIILGILFLIFGKN